MTDIHAHTNLIPHRSRTGARVRDAGDHETAAAVGYVSVVIVVSAAVLMLFNSSGLQTWVRDLPASAASDRLIRAADVWHGWMQSAGLAAPGAFVREAMFHVRDARWGDAWAANIAEAETWPDAGSDIGVNADDSITDDAFADDADTDGAFGDAAIDDAFADDDASGGDNPAADARAAQTVGDGGDRPVNVNLYRWSPIGLRGTIVQDDTAPPATRFTQQNERP